MDGEIRPSCRVLHTGSQCRSPFIIETEDPQADLIDPALKGTQNVLSSVTKVKDTVKKVILTSSVAGISSHFESKECMGTVSQPASSVEGST